MWAFQDSLADTVFECLHNNDVDLQQLASMVRQELLWPI
jgi:hypothetical protein